jgi:uncharacterized membrane protein YgcG
MNVVGNNAAFITTILGIAGLVAVGLGIYWHFNRQAKLRDLAVLRRKLDELEPSDPEYNAARALYTSMMIDAERWDFFHSYAGSDGHSSSSDHHSDGSDDSGGGSDGGGGHH